MGPCDTTFLSPTRLFQLFFSSPLVVLIMPNIFFYLRMCNLSYPHTKGPCAYYYVLQEDASFQIF